MTERTLANAQCAELRQSLKGAHVIKHADKSTAGIPDISVTWAGYTSWIELKRSTGEEHLVTAKVIEPIQVVTCLQLTTASRQRCWVINFRRWFGKYYTELYNPTGLTPRPFTFVTAEDCALQSFLGWHAQRTVKTNTVLRWPDLRYDLCTQLVELTHEEAWTR